MSEETVELNKDKVKSQKEDNASQEEAESLDDKQPSELKEVEKPEEDSFEQKYYYLAAEMDNLRKRVQREKEQTIKYGNENILRDMIGVMDTFELTSNALKNDKDEKVKNIVIGLDMINKQFVEALKGHGLQIVDTEGKDFDPNFHEALAKEVSPKHKENKIIREEQKGYLLNGRLLRASKVIVAENNKENNK